MLKTDVPAEIFPVLTATAFVAAMPVPASPSGGQNGIPASSSPVGSRNFAPFVVSVPAFSPAIRTLGNKLGMVNEELEIALISGRFWNFSIKSGL